MSNLFCYKISWFKCSTLWALPCIHCYSQQLQRHKLRVTYYAHFHFQRHSAQEDHIRKSVPSWHQLDAKVAQKVVAFIWRVSLLTTQTRAVNTYKWFANLSLLQEPLSGQQELLLTMEVKESNARDVYIIYSSSKTNVRFFKENKNTDKKTASITH